MQKFRIPTPIRTENKSIRFPMTLIKEVEQAIRGTDCTFSAFVIEAVRAALHDLRP